MAKLSLIDSNKWDWILKGLYKFSFLQKGYSKMVFAKNSSVLFILSFIFGVLKKVKNKLT
jgi:hypothetical protein